MSDRKYTGYSQSRDSTFTKNKPKSLYDILQVPQNATQNEIKAVYRRLAKQFHPDINASPEASAHMAEINHAYSILSNSATRAAYDTSLRLADFASEPRFDAQNQYDSAVAFAQQAKCQNCSRFDDTLRISVFPYVVSILILSFRQGEAGIFCASCRSSKSTQWGLFSLFLGPWGVPWGVLWTLEALIVNFIKKGKTPKEENKSFLLQLGWSLAILGRTAEAKNVLECLLKYGWNEDVRELSAFLGHVTPRKATNYRRMPNCYKCGKQVGATAKFCKHCGSKIN